MKNGIRIFGCLALMLMLFSFSTNKKVTGEKILQKMYKRYAGKWFRNYTFSQITENYKNDSLIKTLPWHETIVYPDYFRMTFGEPKEGNAIIYVKDSSYLFRKGKLVQKSLRTEDIPFLLGGMYFIPFDSVKPKMRREGFDVRKAHESIFNGKKMYVIGSNTDQEKTNQLWIDKEKLIVVRFIKYLPGMKEEAIMSDHKKLGNGWSETVVIFNINDKLYQKEKYYDCKVNSEINMKVFDPYNFVQ